MKKQVNYLGDRWCVADLLERKYQTGKIETDEIMVLGTIENIRKAQVGYNFEGQEWYYRKIIFKSGCNMFIVSTDPKELTVVGWD